MEIGTNVKIKKNAFQYLKHLNGKTGVIARKGASGKTYEVNLQNGGSVYVAADELKAVAK